jgi:outer membrane protein, multidrug efflux system
MSFVKPVAPLATARSKKVALALLGVSLLVLSACSIKPEPLAQDELAARVASDRARLYSDQPAIDGPLTLHEAMARAIRFNLDARLRAQEQALALNQLDLSHYDLLPGLVASSGYTGRDNASASTSRSVRTQAQSLESSTSQDRDRTTADLNLVWNVLDFGVSYVNAKQNANRALIANERRRKVINSITQDVRAAYWRAVAAERLLGRIDPLLASVRTARVQSEGAGRQTLGTALQQLSYQRALVEAEQALLSQRRELTLARTELAALINQPLDRPLRIAVPAERDTVPELTVEAALLEETALAFRPELREEHLTARITADETRKALLRLLPGLEFNVGRNYDTNSFLENNTWSSWGTRVSWNLLRLFSAPAQIRAAQAAQDVADQRRVALSMAVLTQLFVSRANFEEAKRRFETARTLESLDARILEQLRSELQAQRAGELAVIQGELNAVRAALQRDLAYAEVNNAFGQIFVAIGADPLPRDLDSLDLKGLADGLREVERGWGRGQFALPTQFLTQR